MLRQQARKKQRHNWTLQNRFPKLRPRTPTALLPTTMLPPDVLTCHHSTLPCRNPPPLHHHPIARCGPPTLRPQHSKPQRRLMSRFLLDPAATSLSNTPHSQ
ncbi:hypothetical protein HPB50_026194 [Hyalomma asiaticum]|uniref:Uncharacterized protein n=1 Tax=Hyalomma asiaticum TaxID=266040 RepID=A0ACB7TMF9_HYAAI|nr:hypothetical protein HPB50_026194 [Hyalomma asiaticum]